MIAGVGHVTRHPAGLEDTTEPVLLLAEAVGEAVADAGVAASVVDSLDVVNLVSWRYEDPVSAVAAGAGLGRVGGVYSRVGGDQPTRLIASAAASVASGISRVRVVVGGEASRSRAMWARAGATPPWTARPPSPPLDYLRGLGHGASGHGLVAPASVYPLFENAFRAAHGIGLAEGQAIAGQLWSGMSEVAAVTPGAWEERAFSAQEVVEPGPSNRWIAHPYTKRMCAQPGVDQAAAVVVCSLAAARRAGVSDDRLVHLWSHAGASDTTEVLERPSFSSSEPLEACLRAALASAGLEAGGVDLWELYSCFPVVPEMALRVLGLPRERQVTVAGGLSFYGAPLNAYMLAATVNMVRLMRAGRGSTGVLHANGGYLTYQHVLVLGRDPGPGGPGAPPQAEVDVAGLAARPAPPIDSSPEGTAAVETFTVVYDRDGALAAGIVVGRSGKGRFVATTPAGEAVDALLAGACEVVGARGKVRSHHGANSFELA